MKLMTWKRRNFPMASCEMISRWWFIDIYIYIYVEDIEVLDSSMDVGNAYVLTTWLEQGKTPEILVHWGDPTHSRSRYGMMEVRFVKTKGNPTSYLGWCLENCHEKIQLWVTHGHFRWVMYGHVVFFLLCPQIGFIWDFFSVPQNSWKQWDLIRWQFLGSKHDHKLWVWDAYEMTRSRRRCSRKGWGVVTFYREEGWTVICCFFGNVCKMIVYLWLSRLLWDRLTFLSWK